MKRKIARVGDRISWKTLYGERKGNVYKVVGSYLFVKLDTPREPYNYEVALRMNPDLTEEQIHRNNGGYVIEEYGNG